VIRSVYTGNGWVAFEWVEGRDEGTLRSGMAIVMVATERRFSFVVKSPIFYVEALGQCS